MSEATPLWRAFADNEITHSGAHYLLAIASLIKTGERPRAAASLQLRTLQEHEMVTLDGEQRLALTALGADLVARVASKHEVLLVCLRELLGVRARTAELDACKVEHLLSEESGAALVRLIRFARSDEPVAQAFVAAFRRTTAHCPPGARCELCSEACLLAAGKSA
jgi:Mn-dependent DtxR family transcriptional regulator